LLGWFLLWLGSFFFLLCGGLLFAGLLGDFLHHTYFFVRLTYTGIILLQIFAGVMSTSPCVRVAGLVLSFLGICLTCMSCIPDRMYLPILFAFFFRGNHSMLCVVAVCCCLLFIPSMRRIRYGTLGMREVGVGG
jgi:hypothetical protein